MHIPSILSKPISSVAVAVTFFGSVAGQAQTTSTSTQAKKAPVKAAPAPAKSAPAKPAVTVAKPAPVKTVAVANKATAATNPVRPATQPVAPVASGSPVRPVAGTANQAGNSQVVSAAGVSPASGTVQGADTRAKPTPVKTVTAANQATAATNPLGSATQSNLPATSDSSARPVASTANQAGNSQVVSTAGVNPASGTVQTTDTGAGATPASSAFAPNNASASGGAQTPLGYAAGLGTFRAGDTTVTAFSCLRSGTRVFCDFDETKQQSAQYPAGYAYNTVKLVVGSERVVPIHAAHYVDQDGSTFDTAELSSNVPVRMILEYDDVPAQYTVAALAYGSDRIESIPITPMAEAQPAGVMPSRQQPAAAGSAQTAQAGSATAAAGGATDPSAKADGATDKASQGIDKVNNTKSNLKSLWKKAGTITQ